MEIENRKVVWCFQGIEKGCIGNDWVKYASNYDSQESIQTLSTSKMKCFAKIVNGLFPLSNN